MRKVQKQQLEELAGQMEEAHSQIKKDMEQGNFPSAMGLLEDCQNGGISMGTLIEATEGEGHPTVGLLEEYCELVYRIYGKLEGALTGGDGFGLDNSGKPENLENGKDSQNQGGRDWNAGKVHKLLRQKLLKVSNSINNDIKVRKEAVFLPYKASMWDSMESVWKAADADRNCDAYVIPIPYYDRNADGNFGEMHYEGDQYPDYVPVIYYGAYDFGARMPDIIFIHNPYDQYNFVTSVAPFFYSENLKKFTDMLVYIPYFVLGEIKPEDTDAVENIKHFCTSPGVFHADRVIVQSEDMKQVYIKVLMDATNDHGEAAKKYWNGKILGLGSPKLDKVLDTDKDSLTVPEDWLDIIKKPDGSWKKVVFYNTSVGALLQYSEKMLEKMRHVFRIFRENKEEVALLWRPHPLVKATVSSMRPQLWTEYEGLVREYLEEGWGIYDETADVDRAIVLSDAYYGDGSSVVTMYQQTGKPVMIQDVKILQEDKPEGDFYVTKWLVDGEYAYFVPFDFNIFIKYNLRKRKAEWILPLDKVHATQKGVFSDIVKYKNKVILVPCHIKEFVIVDLERQSVEYVTMPEPENGIQYGFFSKGILYGNQLVAVGYLYSIFLKMNLDTYAMEIVDDSYWRSGNIRGIRGTCSMFSIESCVVGNAVYVLGDNRLIKYDFERDKVMDFPLLNETGERYKSICHDGNFFWFTGNGKDFLKWHEDAQTAEWIRLEKKEAIPEKTLYRYSAALDGKIYFFSSLEAPVVIIDMQSKEKTELLWADESIKKGFRVDAYQRESSECFLFTYQTKEIWQIPFGSSRKCCPECNRNWEVMGDVIRKSGNGYVTEETIGLSEYLEVLVKARCSKETIGACRVGSGIYRYILAG